MGYLDRIRNWFRQFFNSEPKTKGLTPEKTVPSEVAQLKNNHHALNEELEEIRKKLAEIDERLNTGEMEGAEHDREYRQYLARAGRIQLRQMEIRARLEELDSSTIDPST